MVLESEEVYMNYTSEKLKKPPNKGQPPNNGQRGMSHLVRYSEVPLYYSYAAVVSSIML